MISNRNCLGDWAPEAAKEAATAKGSSLKRKRVATVSEKHYLPNADRDQQLEIRGRFLGAIRAAVAAFGGSASITPATTWEDLFPDKVPETSPLHGFYYPLAKYKDKK